MISALKLEALLYNILSKHINIGIYNHVPDHASAPFIRIGDINARQWLIAPPSSCVTVVLGIFSDEPSNKEAIEISSNVREVLSAHLTRDDCINIVKVNILETRIFQLKNLSWCAEIEVKVHQYLN